VPAAIVFAAAPLEPTPRLRARLHSVREPIVIAADAGAPTALAFGFTPNLVIGDFDSLDPSTLGGLRRETFPRDKDQTDGQLAVERAIQQGATELYLVGFLGGSRLDMTVANVWFLTAIDAPAVLLDERNEARLLRGPGEYIWAPEPSEIVSLVPMTELVDGVTTNGLRWELKGDRLRTSETRGVSNEPSGGQARVELARGLLLLTRHFPL
jgi:thiamine pyrophosphokinase